LIIDTQHASIISPNKTIINEHYGFKLSLIGWFKRNHCWVYGSVYATVYVTLFDVFGIQVN